MCNALNGQFKTWMSWWNQEDEENSLLNQIVNMMRNAAVFKILQIAWEPQPQREEGSATPNSTLLNFIRYTYGEAQIAAIARLLDTRSDVVSLKRLVADIKSHCTCLTRQNMLEVWKLPYEWESGYADTRSPDWGLYHRAKLAHERIDRLAGVSSETRGPTDTIRKCVFDWVDEKLDTVDLKSIVQYRHKFVGHSATQKSRKDKRCTADFGLTYSKILKATKTLCQTTALITENILGSGCAWTLPLPEVDEIMDNSLVVHGDIAAVRTQWNQSGKDMKTWMRWDWDNEFAQSLLLVLEGKREIAS